MDLTYWTKTDNSGMLYPLILTLSQQSNYEISVTLSNSVNPDLLKKALVNTYQRYKFFKVELQNNLFRATFVENNREVIIHKYGGKLIGRINFNKNNNYLIEVSYIDSEVHVKFFHGLADANGAVEFIKYLVCQYLTLSGVTINDKYFELKEGEDSNAYQHYFDKNVSKKGLISNAKSSALQVKGKFFKHDGLGYILGEIDAKKAMETSKNFNCSLTVLLGAVAIQTVCEIYKKDNSQKKPALFLPVNLRKFFPSNTMTNFVSSAKCVINGDTRDLSSIIEELKEVLANELKLNNLKRAISLASTVATNPITRFCPFFLKRMLITFGRELVTKGTQTMILSNLGVVRFPDEVLQYVKDVNFFLNCNRRTPVNMTVYTFNDKLSVCFTRHIVKKDIEALFFKKMRALGLDFEISANYREDEYDL